MMALAPLAMVAAVAVLIASGCAVHDRQRAKGHYTVGLEHLKTESYEEAAGELREAIRYDGDNGEYYYTLGLTYTYIDPVSENGEAAYRRYLLLASEQGTGAAEGSSPSPSPGADLATPPLPEGVEAEGGRLEDRAKKMLITAFYNLACIYSLRGDVDAAFVELQRAFDEGFDDYHLISTDRELDNIEDDPRLRELVETKWPGKKGGKIRIKTLERKLSP